MKLQSDLPYFEPFYFFIRNDAELLKVFNKADFGATIDREDLFRKQGDGDCKIEKSVYLTPGAIRKKNQQDSHGKCLLADHSLYISLAVLCNSKYFENKKVNIAVAPEPDLFEVQLDGDAYKISKFRKAITDSVKRWNQSLEQDFFRSPRNSKTLALRPLVWESSSDIEKIGNYIFCELEFKTEWVL